MNQTSILLLGIPGGTNDGPDLSDSIIVLNYRYDTNHMTMFNIPRDIWSPVLRDKVNSAYAYGEAKKVKDGGLILAKSEVGAIVGFPIHYAAVIDFKKFEQVIDSMGGIDVDIQKTFTDTKFPIDGKENDVCPGDPEFLCRYETITFEKGMHHMDGKTALKFVRSRHAEGSEGNDFAREKRQQLVIQAVSAKLISLVTSNNIQSIQRIYKSIDTSINRDISNQEVSYMAKHILLGKRLQNTSFALPESLFYVPEYDDYDGKYVLVPYGEDMYCIHTSIACVLTGKSMDDCLNSLEQKCKEYEQ